MQTIQITFVGSDAYEPLLNTSLFSSKGISTIIEAAPHPCSCCSRAITVRQGDKVISTANDHDHESDSASANLLLLAKLHKNGLLCIESVNGISLEQLR